MTRFVVLICILPLFAQSFYYLLPVAPLYYLSKVWPVLMLPAAAWALTRLQLQSRTVYVVWLAYALGLTPLKLEQVEALQPIPVSGHGENNILSDIRSATSS